MSSIGSNTVETFLRNSDAFIVSVVLIHVRFNSSLPHTALKVLYLKPV